MRMWRVCVCIYICFANKLEMEMECAAFVTQSYYLFMVGAIAFAINVKLDSVLVSGDGIDDGMTGHTRCRFIRIRVCYV